jgi:ATP-dependent protease ClpP protease subunit
MFKLIGGAVVYGFAIYGVMKALEKPDIVIDITPEQAADALLGQQQKSTPSEQA